MGSIKAAVKAFDGTDELSQVQKELITSLEKYASSKAKLFEAEIKSSLRTAGDKENQTVPISSIVASKSWIHAYSGNSDAIGPEVKKNLESFSPQTKKGVVDGISNLITTSLNILLGESSASADQLEEYYLMVEGAAVVRVDLKAWKQSIEATGIRDKVQSIGAFVATKSVVDLSKIDFSTFTYFFQKQLGAAEMDNTTITEAITEMVSVYQMYPAKSGLLNVAQTHITLPPASLHIEY